MTTVPASRCTAHPSRPAVDDCPVCDRPRCGPDRASFGARGCPLCTADAGPAAVAPERRELLVRAGIAAYAVALGGGWIATQYVRTKGFSLIAPALVGVAVAWAAAAAAGALTRRLTLAVASVAAVLSAALAFRVYADGGLSPVHPAGRVLPPYLIALAGVLAWPLLFGPRRRGDDD